MADTLELVIITGMSGAGKTVAVRSFEDLGYYCIDNMPPTLLPTFWELMKESGKITKIALVIDLRTREFFSELEEVINQLKDTQSVATKILFLEADDEALVSRYKESRRSHPLAMDGLLTDGIDRERELLADIRTRANFVIDTSSIAPRELKKMIVNNFASDDHVPFHVEVMSFGFKHGNPIEADVLIDVRFLPNPYYLPEMRALTGQDKPVYDYVMEQPATATFYEKFMDLITFCLPGYKSEGKKSVIIAIGCTGGQHRSVALAERIAEQLKQDNYIVNLSHRDIHIKANQLEE